MLHVDDTGELISDGDSEHDALLDRIEAMKHRVEEKRLREYRYQQQRDGLIRIIALILDINPNEYPDFFELT